MIGCLLFVYACYPYDRKDNVIYILVILLFSYNYACPLCIRYHHSLSHNKTHTHTHTQSFLHFFYVYFSLSLLSTFLWQHKRSAIVLPYLLGCCVCGRRAKVFQRDVDVDVDVESQSQSQSQSQQPADLLLGMSSCERMIRKHCSSDWLLGTWIVLWATFVAVFCFAGYTLYCYSWGASQITDFVNICT